MSVFINQLVENFNSMDLFLKCVMVFYTFCLLGFIISYSMIVIQMLKYTISNLIRK
jgi:hypothetical protein